MDFGLALNNDGAFWPSHLNFTLLIVWNFCNFDFRPLKNLGIFPSLIFFSLKLRL